MLLKGNPGIYCRMDKGGSHDRTKIFKEYKANRDETPEAIKIAVPYIEKILKSLNIAKW